MYPTLQRKIQEMPVFPIDCCALIDYAQQLEGLKGYRSKAELAQNWKEESHFMWISHIKHWTVTPLTSNVDKKLWGLSAVALKKGDCRKSKGSWFLILCYNCDKKEHIHLNCPHPLKDDAHQIQAVKASDVSPASEHSKNLKGFQQSEVLKGCHSNYKEWLFQLWSWLQKETENVRFLLTAVWILILFIKVWWRSEESTLLRSCRGILPPSMKRNYLIMVYMISRCMHMIMMGEWTSTAGSSTLSRYQG